MQQIQEQFWNLSLEPGKIYKTQLKNDLIVCKAVLDTSRADREGGIVQVQLIYQNQIITVASLSMKHGVYQSNLSFEFKTGDVLGFTTNGAQIPVTLFGQSLDVENGSDDESEEEPEKHNRRKSTYESTSEDSFSDLVVAGKSAVIHSAEPIQKATKKRKFENEEYSNPDNAKQSNLAKKKKKNKLNDEMHASSHANEKGKKSIEVTKQNYKLKNQQQNKAKYTDESFEKEIIKKAKSFSNKLDKNAKKDLKFTTEKGPKATNNKNLNSAMKKKDSKSSSKKMDSNFSNEKNDSKSTNEKRDSKCEKERRHLKSTDKKNSKSTSYNGAQSVSNENSKYIDGEKLKFKNKKAKENDSIKIPTKVISDVSEDVHHKKAKERLKGGVEVTDIKVGSGSDVSKGSLITIFYEGRLQSSGEVFDSNNFKAPCRFRIGQKEVIKGWEVGCRGMKVGGKRRIVVPPKMGYGIKSSNPSVPSNETLIYDVTVVGCQ